MPGFALTPMDGFPPITDQDFPEGIQFQLDGVNVGTTAISVINFVPGSVLDVTAGTGETANVLTITIPSGSGT